MNYSDLLLNSDDFNSKPLNLIVSIKKIESIITDLSYLNFIEKINGGFFYNYALHIYSIDTKFEFHDIFKVNETFKKEFGSIIYDEFFFAQDIFGNQFGYSEEGIILFNVETGEKEKIADNFDDWLGILKLEVDYYTGKNVGINWIELNGSIKPDERLYPKKPFVIGGEYEVSNLFPLAFPKYISAYANIANQIYNLPNGTKIKLKITN